MPAPSLSRILALSAFLASTALGQGGSAVITLVMPPPGGEGFTALQSGAALAEGATAAYYNPAALAELHRSTGTSFGTTFSRQDLLPGLRLSDLYQEFQAADVVFADPEGGADLGVGMFRNYTSFGWNTPADPARKPYRSDETVWGLATGVRLGFWLSLGLSAKFIDSRLGRGGPDSSPGDGLSRSFAFDLGVLAMPRFRAPDGFPIPFTLTPSAGIALANLGPDVFYVDAAQSDPVPRTLTGALALSAQAWDLAAVTGQVQAAQEWTWRSDRLSPVYESGIMARLLFLEAGIAYLNDHAGNRRERLSSFGFVFDWAAQARALERLGTGNWTRPSAADYPSGPRWKPFGAKVLLNPRFNLGRREIHAPHGWIRDGQTSWYASFSM
jgi:hypothetical protein